MRGNERTAERRLSESILKFCEALAPTNPLGEPAQQNKLSAQDRASSFREPHFAGAKTAAQPVLRHQHALVRDSKEHRRVTLKGGDGMELL